MIFSSNQTQLKSSLKTSLKGNCGGENGVCNLPTGYVCTIAYGAGINWTHKVDQKGSVGCNNGVFGDPFYGAVKSCKFFHCRRAGRSCANENGICIIPAGKQCTVLYGAQSKWTNKQRVQGSVGCNNRVFGDPIFGIVKSCELTHCRRAGKFCANENGICNIPAGKQCTVSYGAQAGWTQRKHVQGSVGCNNRVFGDPNFGIVKSCQISHCRRVGRHCANENGICNIPAGKQCTILYGAQAGWTQRKHAQGSVGCNNRVFGDPNFGIVKSCELVHCRRAGRRCANENGICNIPAGKHCTVLYGAQAGWTQRKHVQGSIGCNNRVFGDPNIGIVKSCELVHCRRH